MGLYNISAQFYFLFIRLAAFFNPKAKNWVEGRKGLFDLIRSKVHLNEKYIWFHCASVGEFEQGRPLIDAIRSQYPQYKVVLTFFSPSGYEMRKNFNGVDHIFYLPPDTPANAALFLQLVNPRLAVFVKYEFWLGYIAELKKRNISAVLISAGFRPNQVFFKWYGGIFLKALKSFRMIFVLNEESKSLLEKHNIDNVTVANDTRFDRVLAIASEAKSLPLIEKFIAGSTLVFVAGSTWQPDEEIIVGYINNDSSDFRWIIVTHEINPEHINRLRKSIQQPAVLYSELSNGKEVAGEKVLIIDAMGLLSSAYRYSTISYIGGGFGSGIHNVLEAAVYGKAVLFGPRYKKYSEAVDLVECKAGFVINSIADFKKRLETLTSNADILKQSSGNAAQYVKSKSGGTDKILNELKKGGLL